MKSFLIQMFTLLSAVLLHSAAMAQGIAVLPRDPAIVSGTLPDGLNYYLVSDRSAKGQADFALVQKTGRKTVTDCPSEPVAAARKALASPCGTVSSTLQHYMVRHGASPDRDGFVKVTDDATVFLFSGIGISSPAALDSTLMVMMNLVDRCNRTDDDFVSRWYVPGDQAVIVSGDIDPASVAEKLRVMSLMVHSGESLPREEYVWKERPAVFSAVDTDGPLAEVSVTWFSARTPREYMNTVRSEVFAMAMEVMGDIACERIADILEDRSIPSADVRYEYSDGVDSPSDHSFTVRLAVAEKDCEAAVETVSMVMSSMDAAGVTTGERRLAMSRFKNTLREKARRELNGDGDYVDRCISAFMNGSSLASAKERLSYHSSRNIPDTTGVRLLNGIISALLDKDENIEVSVTGMADSLAVRSLFDSVWVAGQEGKSLRSSSPNMSDTLSFPGSGPKVKLKSVKKDHVSGGSVWTFSNGFKVVYRNMPSDGQLHYMLALNGGYGHVEDLAVGEGAYMSDFLDYCYVSGIKGKDFRDILMTQGITMGTKVHLSNLMVSGTAPEQEAGLLMKALLALSQGCSPSEEALGYYAAGEDLALEYGKVSRTARMTAIDSIMCPGYRYSSYKAPGKISPGFAGRTGSYLSSQMAKMNDGLLILVGDIREDKLKKILLDYVGAFRTRDAAVRRPNVRYQPISGWSTYTKGGEENSIDVVMSARASITADSYMTAAVAVMYLEQKLAESLVDTGYHLSVSHVCRVYPEDRVNVSISVSEADPDGFASGGGGMTAGDVLGIIRSLLSDISHKGVDGSAISGYMSRLKNEIAVEMNDPSYWTTAIALRHLDGKDLSTDYASKIDAVTAEKVEAMLSSLVSGSKVEYVIMKD